MTYKAYWKETVVAALEEVKKLTLFTTQDIELMADICQGSAENQSTMFGEDCIPNPLEIEINNLKQKHIIEKQKLEKVTLGYRESVACRYNVNVSRVYLDDGNVRIGK